MERALQQELFEDPDIWASPRRYQPAGSLVAGPLGAYPAWSRVVEGRQREDGHAEGQAGKGFEPRVLFTLGEVVGHLSE